MRLSDTSLLRISLLISFIGLFGLFIIFSLSELPEMSIQSAEDLLDGDKVRIEGRIVSSTIRGNTTFLLIEQSCTINAVIFDKVDVQEGLVVDIVGSMDSYKGKREVLVEEITLLH